MKFIHTGDWHIGKIVNEFYMTSDQEYILNQLIDLIALEKPDALIIAGDLYDRSVAPVEAVELLDRVFSRILLELKTPIIAIAGNHDSPERLAFGSSILNAKGLFIEGILKKDPVKVVLKDDHGPVNFYMVPYSDPPVVRELYEKEDIKCHDDAMKCIIDNIKENMNLNERNVIICHGFVVGSEEPETSESERPLSIGGTEYIKAEYFNAFNYTALGHLHGAQRVSGDKIRYSGSLMKYSFSEVNHKKSVTLVNIDEKGEVSIELKELNPKRDMRRIKGSIKDLLNPEVYKDTDVEDYINVILTDEGEILDAIGQLRAVYPNIMMLNRENCIKNNEPSNTAAALGYKQKSKLELFNDFYTNITGLDFSEDKKSVLVDILEKVEKEEWR